MPEWAEEIVRILRENGRVQPVDSIGCSAVEISATGEELLDWMGAGVGRGEISFPASNGPIRWANETIAEALKA